VRLQALIEERDDGFPASGIILELFEVVSVLSFRPDRHLEESGEREDQGRNALRHGGEGDPGSHLEGVVGTGDEGEHAREGAGRRHGDGPHRGPGGTEVAQGHVDEHVAGLADREGSKSEVHLQVGGRGEEGVVDVECHVEGEEPVVRAVLEEVEDRHRAVGEAVHKQGFKDSFCVVKGVAYGGDVCAGGIRLEGRSIPEEEPWAGVHVQVDNQWASIFNDKYGFPTNLGTKVF